MNYEILKKYLAVTLVKLNSVYLFLNQELLFAWRRLLAKQSDNRITSGLKILIENPATALFLNTVLFYVASSILFGNAGLFGMALNLLAFLNIVSYLVNKLGFIDKLSEYL